ncbi:MAG: uroporphyrinogen decarboxylase [Acetobacteraceae bacterium]|nr:uroporphyrinogen decarboxylase [Acetobacteraceae bacterium]
MPKPLLRTLAGETLWPPPVWLMRQAGRYLPEYRAVRAQAGDFIALCTAPALAAEVTLQPVRRFGMDGAILFSDILILPWALGYGLAFHEGEGPVLPRLEDRASVDRLDPARMGERVAPVLETVRLVREALDAGFPGTALIGFAGAPFTVACYMVEGGGTKEFARARRMVHAEPALFAALMERLAAATVEYLALQAAAGAESLMLFDSWAGLLPPRLFAEHVIEPARRIRAALRERYPGVPFIGFPRLAGIGAARYAATTGVDAVALDTGADLARIGPMLPADVATQGNLDPIALVAGGDALAAGVREVLAAAKGRPHVFNLGHGVVPETPPEHVAELVRLVREE